MENNEISDNIINNEIVVKENQLIVSDTNVVANEKLSRRKQWVNTCINFLNIRNILLTFWNEKTSNILENFNTTITNKLLRQINVNSISDLFVYANAIKPIFDKLLLHIIELTDFIESNDLTSDGFDWCIDDILSNEDNSYGYLITMPIKSKERVVTKSQEIYSENEPKPAVSWICDVIRSSIICPNERSIESLIQLLFKYCNVSHMKNRFHHATANGYRDVILYILVDKSTCDFLNLSLTTGLKNVQLICELQIHHVKLFQLSYEHNSYFYYSYFRKYFSNIQQNDYLTNHIVNKQSNNQTRRLSNYFIAATTEKSYIGRIKVLRKIEQLGEDVDELETLMKVYIQGNGRATRDIQRMSLFYDLFILVGEHNLAESVQTYIIQYLRNMIPSVDPLVLSKALSKLATHYITIHKYDEALVLCSEAVALCQSDQVSSGSISSTQLVSRLTELGALYYTQRQYNNAIPIYQNILSILQSIKGKSHLDTITILTVIAELYEDINDWNSAKNVYLSIYNIYKQVSKSDEQYIPQLASTLTNLSHVEEVFGNYEQATKYIIEAIELYMNIYGSDNSSIAHCLFELANIYDQMGQFALAVDTHKRSLTMRQQMSGGESVTDIAIGMNAIAELLIELELYDDALDYLIQALTLRYHNKLTQDTNKQNQYKLDSQLKYDLMTHELALATLFYNISILLMRNITKYNKYFTNKWLNVSNGIIKSPKSPNRKTRNTTTIRPSASIDGSHTHEHVDSNKKLSKIKQTIRKLSTIYSSREENKSYLNLEEFNESTRKLPNLTIQTSGENSKSNSSSNLKVNHTNNITSSTKVSTISLSNPLEIKPRKMSIASALKSPLYLQPISPTHENLPFFLSDGSTDSNPKTPELLSRSSSSSSAISTRNKLRNRLDSKADSKTDSKSSDRNSKTLESLFKQCVDPKYYQYIHYYKYYNNWIYILLLSSYNTRCNYLSSDHIASRQVKCDLELYSHMYLHYHREQNKDEENKVNEDINNDNQSYIHSKTIYHISHQIIQLDDLMNELSKIQKLANDHRDVGMFDEAIAYIHTGINMCKSHYKILLTNQLPYLSLLSSLLTIYEDQNRLCLALITAKDILVYLLQIYQSYPHIHVVLSYFNIGVILIKLNEPVEGLKYLITSLEKLKVIIYNNGGYCLDVTTPVEMMAILYHTIAQCYHYSTSSYHTISHINIHSLPNPSIHATTIQSLFSILSDPLCNILNLSNVSTNLTVPLLPINLSINNEANLYLAEEYILQAIESRRSIDGTKDPDYTSCVNSWALILCSMSKYDVGIKILEDVYMLRKEICGLRHPMCIILQNNLGVMYYMKSFIKYKNQYTINVDSNLDYQLQLKANELLTISLETRVIICKYNTKDLEISLRNFATMLSMHEMNDNDSDMEIDLNNYNINVLFKCADIISQYVDDTQNIITSSIDHDNNIGY